MRPHRRQPTRLPYPWDSLGKNIGVGCHFLLQCMKVKSESEVAQSCPTLVTPWTTAYQAPPPMGFSRQEYWSGVLLPSLDTAPSFSQRTELGNRYRYKYIYIYIYIYTHTYSCVLMHISMRIHIFLYLAMYIY